MLLRTAAAALLSLVYNLSKGVSGSRLGDEKEEKRFFKEDGFSTELQRDGEAHRAILVRRRNLRRLKGPIQQRRAVDASSSISNLARDAMPVVECEPSPADDLTHGNIDVGVLSMPKTRTSNIAQCPDGHFCSPDKLSKKGGLCVPEKTVSRKLQKDFCTCFFEEDVLEDQACFTEVGQGCTVFPFPDCLQPDQLSEVEVYCAYYTCLHEKHGPSLDGLEEKVMDECWCEYYNRTCDLCKKGYASGSLCEEQEYACSMSNCCKSEAFSASECFTSVDIEDYISDLSEEPIYEPTDAPTSEPTILFGLGEELPLEFTCDPAENEEDVWSQCKTTDVGTCILDRDCLWRDMASPNCVGICQFRIDEEDCTSVKKCQWDEERLCCHKKIPDNAVPVASATNVTTAAPQLEDGILDASDTIDFIPDASEVNKAADDPDDP